MNNKAVPQALTIAGSDCSGGAGIQADLKTMQMRGVYGASVIVALTAQNTTGVQNVWRTPDEMIADQLDSVFSDLDIKAMKTGMLPDPRCMEIVAEKVKAQNIPLIVDPVMIAKGGAALMEAEGTQGIIRHILPLAYIVTPNIPEAEVITQMSLKTEEDLITSAKKIQAMGAKNIIIKGGHRLQTEQATDLLYTEDGEIHWFKGERFDTPRTHGTGCTFSACLAAEIAKGKSVYEATATAKAFISAAIQNGILVGHGHGPVNHWAYQDEN